jgi:hypothetical protein
MKVKPLKTKNTYEQVIVRTMFFKRADQKLASPHITFDRKTYAVTNAEDLHPFNCRQDMVGRLWPKLNAEDIDQQLDQENYKGYRTEMVRILKDWEKKYQAHLKTINPGLSAIQRESMLPLTNLFESNFNYFQINGQMAKGKFVPDFRYKALEDRYIEHMETMCALLRDFGDLCKPYDIRQMLVTLKSKDW